MEEENKELQQETAADQSLEETQTNASMETPPEEVTQEPEEDTSGDSEDGVEEIDESNAEDAEDTDNERRHQIPVLDYHSMSMENLVGELQRLVRNEKVQAIRRHVEGIKYEFDLKYQEFLEHKKEEFVSRGGNEVDFRYNSVTKRQFNEVYADYRDKRNQYYKQLEHNLQQNLENRLAIIEELKGLVNVEEDMNTTYNNFKLLQEKWKNAGPVPRTQYNDVWRTYHHHVEIFYDFLHLNRELRDLDFKHNLEEKLKIIEKAEALSEEHDVNKAFRELQTLHKIWKEDIGPVSKEQREVIWERFSNATKSLHKRRQLYFQDIEKSFEENLLRKEDIIQKIKNIAENLGTSHRAIQQQIKEIESLREAFFKAGKVPRNQRDATWEAFKESVRNFNRTKNNYYKGLKKQQQQNLDKKRALLERALSLKDSEDWDAVTPEMKKIQQEWKAIGHVPRKYSDKIWGEFKAACNHYFDRLHAVKNKSHRDEKINLEAKEAILDKLKNFNLKGDKSKDLEVVQKFIADWKAIGRIPFNKKHLNGKFHKIIDALIRKIGLSQQEGEVLKYGNKIQQLAKEENEGAIEKERYFIRKKIEESKAEIRQLENNLQFFSNSSEENPLVKEVISNIERHREALEGWQTKLKKLNILKNNLNKEDVVDDSEE